MCMKVTATLNNVRLTPRKARLVAGLIRGMDAVAATVQLEKVVKKSADPLLKLLRSAMANAQNNFSLKEDTLRVAAVIVNEGQKLKRWMPRAHGRATPLWRRLSHVTIVLEEKTESKSLRTRTVKTTETAVKEEQSATVKEKSVTKKKISKKVAEKN